MTKRKSVLGVLLAVMLMFAFSASMAFAAEDSVTCVVTVAGSDQTIEKTSIDDAVKAVNDEGTITVTGEINNAYAIPADVEKTFTMDTKGAVFADGAKITAASATACLIEKDAVYTYHPAHNPINAEAVPTEKDPSKAFVTMYCEYGDSILLEEAVKGTLVGEDEETVTYEAEVYGFTVSWTVNKADVPDVYAVAEADYIKDATGFAVKDAEGNVQFYATYNKNGQLVYDDDAKPAKLPGTIKGDPADNTPATELAPGSHDYTVVFTLPDESTEEVPVKNVIDTEPLTAEKGDIIGIAFLYEDAEGNVVVGDTLPGESADVPEKYEGATRIMDAAGTLQCCLVYHDKNGGAAPIYGETAELKANNTSVIKNCGDSIFKYDAVTERYTKEDGSITTYSFTANPIHVEGTHEYADKDKWAGEFHEVTAASHNETGTATAKCQFCEKEWTAADPFVIPKTDDHEFKKDAATGEDEITVVEPTCQVYGYSYKTCLKDDGGWDLAAGVYSYELKDGDLVVDVLTSTTKPNWHPVLVDGSVVPKVDHKWYVTSAPITWDTTDEDAVTCSLTQRCMYEQADVQYVYHQAAAPAEPVADDNKVHVYSAITPKVTEGKDCSELNKITYTVDGVTTVDDEPITKTIDSEKSGHHTYKNTVTFSKDGKEATVTQQCTNDKCAGAQDLDGNGPVKKVDAEVTSEDNSDGTTTYTATLDGEVVGTKVVYDLTKAVVTVNGGETLDLNTVDFDETAAETADEYATAIADAAQEEAEAEAQAADDDYAVRDRGQYAWGGRYELYQKSAPEGQYIQRYQNRNAANTARNEYGQAAYDAVMDQFDYYAVYAAAYNAKYAELAGEGFADLVEVTINGAVIDSSLYNVLFTGPEAGKLIEGANVVTVVAAPDSDAVGSADGIVQCIQPGTLTAEGITFDGKAYPEANTAVYDGNAHVIEVTKVTNGYDLEVKDADIKYSVVDFDTFEKGYIDAEITWEEYVKTLTFGDKAEMTDANTYIVITQISKEGYTTKTTATAYVVIEKKTFENAKITVEVKAMKYGDALVATTGDPELDKQIGLSTEKASKVPYSPIPYDLSELVSIDPNYDVAIDDAMIYVEKRNAKIVMKDTTKTYDGKEIDPATLYTVDGLVNDDDLQIVVNTKGDKKISVEPGVYTLVATANNANYNIEVEEGTLTINKIAQKVAKVSPTKKAYKANKKGKLAKNKKFTVKAKATGDPEAKVTFKKANKAGGSKIKVAKSGKVTVKKGLKKGTYKVKVKATKAETAHYKVASKSVTVTIVIK